MTELNRDIIISKLREIKPELSRKYHISALALFGSFARNDQHAGSDIDIMVRLDIPSYRNLCEAVYQIEKIFPGQVIQVVSEGGVRPQYLERIKPDLIYA
jgi:uncharacterized protein